MMDLIIIARVVDGYRYVFFAGGRVKWKGPKPSSCHLNIKCGKNMYVQNPLLGGLVLSLLVLFGAWPGLHSVSWMVCWVAQFGLVRILCCCRSSFMKLIPLHYIQFSWRSSSFYVMAAPGI